ncbi:MAG: hypothetical protein KDI79_08635 [Anaerolineae bacterium]|nr:hypothetical protein [Anaerolineae bacterium]
MLRIDKALTDHLAKRMYVDPGDEDFGQCFFNALRALFRLNRLAPSHRPVYTEGFTVYHHEAAPLPYHRVAAHGWVTQHDQVIDIDYADCGRYEVAYFPGRHWPVEAVYHRLKTEPPDTHHLAFGLVPMGLAMTRAYVAACEYMITTWPEEVAEYDRQRLDEWRQNLRV